MEGRRAPCAECLLCVSATLEFNLWASGSSLHTPSMTASGARPAALCSRRLGALPRSWELLERLLKLPKQDTEALSSTASPIFSKVEAEA